jgi:hypothetical protein
MTCLLYDSQDNEAEALTFRGDKNQDPGRTFCPGSLASDPALPVSPKGRLVQHDREQPSK